MEYSRANPSPRYVALTALYRQMHEEGEKSRGLSAENTFPGRSLPPHAPRIKRLVDLTGAKTLLDYGSGKGMQYRWQVDVDGVEHFASFQEYWGVDTIRCFDPNYAPFSILPQGQFDGVLCTDVLEHCPEEDIPWIIAEIFGYANKFVYANVASYPASKQLPNGENAHCTIKPIKWWSQILSEEAARHPGLEWEFWFVTREEDGAGEKFVEQRLGCDGQECQVPSAGSRPSLRPSSVPGVDKNRPVDDPQNVRALLLEALRTHQAGDFDKAYGLYQRALLLDPNQPDGNRLFGTLCLQIGRFQEAEPYLKRALSLAPADAETHNNLGAVLLHTGRPGEATTSLREALSLRPDYADAYSNLGEALRQTGNAGGARAALEKALALNPDHANALFNLGVLRTAERDYASAAQCLERALAIFPGHVAARRQLVNVFIASGEYLKAEQHCRILLSEAPEDHEVRVALTSIFIAARQYDEARKEVQYVLARAPDHPRGKVCLGQILRQTGRTDEALALFREVAASHPEEPRAQLGVVDVLLRQGELDAALAMAEEVAGRFPKEGLARLDLGTVLEKLGRHEDACATYRAGLALLPDQSALHFNLGNQLLLLGRFEEGWEEYEWRTRLAAWGIRDTSRKTWSGEPIEGKSLLIEAEQGLGDMIQFVRLAPLVADRGATVLLECQPELMRLFQSAAGVRQIVPKPCREEAKPDLRIPLLSLPRILDIRLENIPADLPYLAPPAGLVDAWKARLAGDPGVRVGIAWSGNPQHIDDANRSCPPALLKPLLAVPGATFYSLQKGGSAVLSADGLATAVRDFSNEWTDFADTAAFMQALDLVISVDTAVVHLAGALGRPVWALLPFAPDWRWLLAREDSPWYPTMRLFRARRPRDWQSVIRRAADALTGEIRSQTSP